MLNIIVNIFIGIAIALLINFCLILRSTKQKKTEEEKLLNEFHQQFFFTEPLICYSHDFKLYKPKVNDENTPYF